MNFQSTSLKSVLTLQIHQIVVTITLYLYCPSLSQF